MTKLPEVGHTIVNHLQQCRWRVIVSIKVKHIIYTEYNHFFNISMIFVFYKGIANAYSKLSLESVSTAGVWLDDAMFTWKVGEEWIRLDGKFVWGKYRGKYSNYQLFLQHGINTCIDNCRNRGLNVVSQIKKSIAKVVFLMWWCDVFLIF